MGAILLTVVSLAAVALIAWMLAAGVESGVRAHREERESAEKSGDEATST